MRGGREDSYDEMGLTPPTRPSHAIQNEAHFNPRALKSTMAANAASERRTGMNDVRDRGAIVSIAMHVHAA
jgi:hypothetical protein